MEALGFFLNVELGMELEWARENKWEYVSEGLVVEAGLYQDGL